MFLQHLQDDQRFFFSAIATVIISITLHELAHGYTAVALGDDTPIRLRRLTLNPLVHMGPWSILAMFIMGIAWGMMPIDPTRLRGRYAEALVCLAGPATNLLLAVVALAALAFWQHATFDPSPVVENWQYFLRTFGYINIGLMIFNLLPIPPLDGSGILGNIIPAYRRLISSGPHGLVMLVIVIVALNGLGETEWGLWQVSGSLTRWFLQLLGGG